ERGGADDDRAVVVLERARHDLGGGGGVAVHEDDDRLVADDGAAAGAVLVRRLVAVADGDDGLPALEEEVADVHGRVEAAAAVAAQVDDEGGRALPPQRAHRLCDLLAGVLVEALERDVAHAVVEEDRERHGRDVDDGAGEAAADRLVHPLPYERDLDLGAGPAEQAAGHLLQLQAAGGLAVDLDDAVARAHGAALRGRVGEHAGDGGDAALVLDLHAEPAVGGADLLAGEAGDLLGRVQCGVRVVELLDESAGGHLVDGVPVQRLDGVALDVLEDLGEQAGSVARPAILDNGPCPDGSNEQQQGSDDQPRPTHWCDLLDESGTGLSAPRRR